MATFMIHVSVLFLGLIPGLLITWLVDPKDIMPHGVLGLLSMWGAVVAAYVVVIGFLAVISLIGGFFLKKSYRLEGDCLLVCERNQMKTICYGKVAHCVFDFGCIRRYGGADDTELVLFDEEMKLLLNIKDPSLLMTILLWRKCPFAKKDYYNRGMILGYLVFFCGVVLIRSLWLKFR